MRSAYSEGAVLWYSEAVQTVSGEHARSVYRVMLVDSYSSADEHTVAVLQVRSEVEVAAAVWYSAAVQVVTFAQTRLEVAVLLCDSY